MAASLLNASGEFASDAFLNAEEQSAAAKLTESLQKELAEEGEAISVATAFVTGMIGGETAIATLAVGGGVFDAAAAGVAAGEAASLTTGTVIASGPAAPIAIGLLAVPEILTAIWGAHGGQGCCGAPPDPTPLKMPITNVPLETKARAASRALAAAKAANANAACGGNRTYESEIGTYPSPPNGSFQEYAYALIRGAIDQADTLKCWPVAQVNWGKLIQMALTSWNATHAGPTSTLGLMLGGGGRDPLTFALAQAIPADGTIAVSTGQTRGFTQTSQATWDGVPFKFITLKVNTGAAIAPVISQKGTSMLPFNYRSVNSLLFAAPSTATPAQAAVSAAIVRTTSPTSSTSVFSRKIVGPVTVAEAIGALGLLALVAKTMKVW